MKNSHLNWTLQYSYSNVWQSWTFLRMRVFGRNFYVMFQNFWLKKEIAKVHQNSHRKQLVVVLRSTFASRVDREFSLLWEWGVLRWKGEPGTLLDPHPWGRIQSWVCDGSTWRELENHIICSLDRSLFTSIILNTNWIFRVIEKANCYLERTSRTALVVADHYLWHLCPIPGPRRRLCPCHEESKAGKLNL